MGISIEKADQLEKLLKILSQEIVYANIYHRLYSDLVNSRKHYAREFSQSQTFWGLTLNALYDAIMIRLCGIFDQEPRSLNLFNLLETIRANLRFFEKEEFRERLKDNASVDSLAEVNRIPDEAQLKEDILFASEQNPLVKKLMIWRNNIIAHKGARVSLGKNKILANNPLSEKDIQTLLNGSYTILDRYSYLYTATALSRHAPGQDDYKHLLESVRMALQKWD